MYNVYRPLKNCVPLIYLKLRTTCLMVYLPFDSKMHGLSEIRFLAIRSSRNVSFFENIFLFLKIDKNLESLNFKAHVFLERYNFARLIRAHRAHFSNFYNLLYPYVIIECYLLLQCKQILSFIYRM